MGMRPSHILTAIFRHLKNRPVIDDAGIQSYREFLEKGAAVFKPDGAMHIEPMMVKGMDARWISPKGLYPKRVIFYVHGGGFIAGSVVSHQDLASRIAKACQANLLIFNYRLAPEHPFPQGLLDVKAAYEWLVCQYQNRAGIILMGDSAGGGLALSLISGLLKDRVCLPSCLVLLSPWADLECKNPSHSKNQDKDPMLSTGVLKKTAALYSAGADLADPLISPVNSDFSGLPPTLIQTGENEVLLDDSILLAQKFKAAGSVTELEIWEGMFHVWHYFAKYLPEARMAIDKIASFVRQHSPFESD